MPPELPFAALVARLQIDDADAACLVVELYARRLVALAASRLPHTLSAKLDPEDVVQSVFKSFFARHAGGQFSLDNWDSLWTLLTVLTVRKCGHRVRHFRAARRDVRREVAGTAGPDRPESLCDPPAAEPTPAETVMLAETLADLLRDLDPSQRAVVQLRLEGHTFEEISRLACCTERTAYRVLEKVRARLESLCAENAEG
jgi:RNA polymerase sigma-70 factor (ECF subfamily)